MTKTTQSNCVRLVAVVYDIPHLVLWICFVFGASDFEFQPSSLPSNQLHHRTRSFRHRYFHPHTLRPLNAIHC